MNTECFFETDIACENECAQRRGKMQNSFNESGMKITKTTFDPSEQNGILPRDAYYGIHCGPIWEFNEDMAISASMICADKISRLLKPLPCAKKRFSVLVAGIGNRNAAPDMLGPLCTDKILTRQNDEAFLPRVYATAPGVCGQTGIDTSIYVRAIAEAVNADIIIAVDSLSAKETEHLGSFIQIGNCGITPGSGLSKRGKGISYSTMGIPVISIGIPTVIRASAFTDTSSATDKLKSFSVTPTDCNAVTEIGAAVISRAINACLNDPSCF